MTESQSNVRALVLMGVGIVVGVLVLGVGFGDDPLSTRPTISQSPVATPTPEPEPTPDPALEPEAEDGTGEAEEVPTPTATPDPALHPVSEVRVIVANSTDVAGAAAAVSDSLVANGGYNATAADATGPRNVLPNTVYFVDGYEADARQVAALAALPETTEFVEMVPDPPVQDLSDAHVLVVLGIESVPAE